MPTVADPVAASFYRYHVFFCTNQRPNGLACCQDHDAEALRDYAKAQMKKLQRSLPHTVRINTAGCLDRCSHGPVMVVYPEAIWYTYQTREDIDAIIDEHLVQGHVVERLRF